MKIVDGVAQTTHSREQAGKQIQNRASPFLIHLIASDFLLFPSFLSWLSHDMGQVAANFAENMHYKT
jgi:hypothetical protein